MTSFRELYIDVIVGGVKTRLRLGLVGLGLGLYRVSARDPGLRLG